MISKIKTWFKSSKVSAEPIFLKPCTCCGKVLDVRVVRCPRCNHVTDISFANQDMYRKFYGET